MATLLLVVIYTAYIGLGIPDSLFGAAWPAIYTDLSLPISYANFITVLSCLSTIASSLLSYKLINKFGTSLVTAASTTMTALALLGFSLSGNFFFLCLFSVPLGFGAGAIDTAQNNYVAIHYNARHMSFLHCFYGVGVSLSPYLMSLGLENGGWRTGYTIVFICQAVISAVCIAAIPLWNKAHPQNVSLPESEKPKNISVFELAKRPAVRATWLMFVFSCGIESICTTWGSTFLVESKGVAPSEAAKMVVVYFVGLAIGRFVSGLLSGRFTPWNLIHMGSAILLAAIGVLMLPIKSIPLACVCLFFTGFGVGPIYPNLTYLTPIHFGKDISGAVIGSQMAVAYVGILILPVVFGFIAETLSVAIFPFFIGALYVILMISMFALMKHIKNVADR